MTRTNQLVLTFLLLAILTPAVTGAGAAPAPAQPARASQGGGTTVDSDQQQATRQDLQKMRAILNQMRTNLGFVGSTTTPLNHQLELDIEMWQMLLDQMERRVNQDGGRASQPSR